MKQNELKIVAITVAFIFVAVLLFGIETCQVDTFEDGTAVPAQVSSIISKHAKKSGGNHPLRRLAAIPQSRGVVLVKEHSSPKSPSKKLSIGEVKIRLAKRWERDITTMKKSRSQANDHVSTMIDKIMMGHGAVLYADADF